MARICFFILVVLMVILNFGCSRKVAPPPDSLEGWRYIFSVEPVQPDTIPIPASPYDTLTPQRIER